MKTPKTTSAVEMVYDFTDQPTETWWWSASAFVAKQWPAAKHEGVGYWRIPRKARIFYGVGKVTYRPM